MSKPIDRQNIDRVFSKFKEDNDKLKARIEDMEHHEGVGREPYILIQEQQASGTDAGTFTSGAWRTRVLNTEVVDTGNNATLAANQITLLAGTYRFRAAAPAWRCEGHQLRVRNITAGTTIADGIPSFSNNGAANAQTISEAVGRFTLAVDSVIEVQHQCTTTRALDGFGKSVAFGDINVFASIELWRED